MFSSAFEEQLICTSPIVNLSTIADSIIQIASSSFTQVSKPLEKEGVLGMFLFGHSLCFLKAVPFSIDWMIEEDSVFFWKALFFFLREN